MFIETYGCRYNFGDTAKLVEILKNKGSIIVDSAEDADSVIINSCTVVGPTERRMLKRLAFFRDYDLYVTGCMPAVQREAIFAVCSPTILPSELIHEAYRNVGTVGSGGVGIVQVARGCRGTCTYCLTRIARGSLNSFPEDEISGQILAHTLAGTPEIQITAQDISSWGMDRGKSLPFLLQRYFGLPLAMIVLSVTAVPLYRKLKVYTAYEFLERRFDVKVRTLAALLFLVQRGLACGLTIYAPAVVLSVLLGWNLYVTNRVIGVLVIIYTASGGTKAVSHTNFWQMVIILGGLLTTLLVALSLLPENVSFTDAVHVAGRMGRLNAIDFSFDWNNRYTFWSGLIGGFFLALSYFGTDQSQVGRYRE